MSAETKGAKGTKKHKLDKSIKNARTNKYGKIVATVMATKIKNIKKESTKSNNYTAPGWTITDSNPVRIASFTERKNV